LRSYSQAPCYLGNRHVPIKHTRSLYASAF
jgi:hypothetical protein